MHALQTKLHRGFSTLEMLIAMSIMTIVLSGVVIVSFGNQGMLLGGEENAEAMNKAQELLEQEQQLGRKDFRLVNSFATTTDGIYQKSTFVEAWEADPYTTKRVTVFISWVDQNLKTQTLQLSTLISNFTNAVGGDTCNSAPIGNWNAPAIDNYALSAGDLLPGGMAGTFTLGSVDAYRGRLFATASNTSAPGLPTFFIFNISNSPQKPGYISSIDTGTSVSGGLNAAVAGNSVRDISTGVVKSYAYAANGYGASFNTCTPGAGSAGGNCSQMQVIDITDPSNPSVAFNFKFATSSASVPNLPPYVTGSAGAAVGKSIFYKDGYVYLGLTAATGPEFHIIDVHNPLTPHAVGPGFEVGNDVNAIYVRGKYAYLATPNSQELLTINLEDPLVPVPAGGFNSSQGSGNGKSFYSVGNTLYFGVTVPNTGNDFHILDISNPGSALPSLGGIDQSSSVDGLIVRDTLAYLLTNTSLSIFNIANPASIGSALATLSLPGNGQALDCEANTLYAGSNSGSNGFISVVKPGN